MARPFAEPAKSAIDDSSKKVISASTPARTYIGIPQGCIESHMSVGNDHWKGREMMNTLITICHFAKRRFTHARRSIRAATPLLIWCCAHASSAQAADGCKVMLCLAAPNWRNIPECVPPIHEVMRDLARGRPFPVCTMSGNGNNAQHQWSSAPVFCPPQYTRVVDGANEPRYVCDYAGAFSIEIDGAPWSRTWWQFEGDSVTEFFPAAKARLGTWDTRFEEDYARWLASQPQTPSDPN